MSQRRRGCEDGRDPRYLSADLARSQSPGVKTSKPPGTSLALEQSAKSGCC